MAICYYSNCYCILLIALVLQLFLLHNANCYYSNSGTHTKTLNTILNLIKLVISKNSKILQ